MIKSAAAKDRLQHAPGEGPEAGTGREQFRYVKCLAAVSGTEGDVRQSIGDRNADQGAR